MSPATLDGSFQMLGHDWYWDVNGVWGRNKAEQEVHGNINAANLARALGPVAACTAPCVPFNIFGGAGSITPAMLDYRRLHPARQQPAAAVGLLAPTSPAACSTCPAARSASRSASSIATRRAASIPIRSSPPASARTFRRCRPRAATTSTRPIAELRLPLLRDTPFFHRLELTGAARYSDYSTSGSTTTFSAGINWQPIEDLLFRGSWAEGFRAPSIGELFGTPSRFDQEVVDPCSGMTGGDRRPTIRANCIADGVPANGSYVQLNAQLPVVTGGNPDLDAGDLGKLGLRRGLAAELPAAALARGQLLQHQGRRRDPGDRRRRPCSAAAPRPATR